MDKEIAKKLIADNFIKEGRYSYSVMVEIQGKYLVENNLVEAWSILRNQSIQSISAPGYVDSITLLQAMHLGLLDFVNKHNSSIVSKKE
jgi:hypothetical protein